MATTYKDACAELADELGWQRSAVWAWFEQCSMLRQYEQRIPKALAHYFALQDIRAMLDKRGAIYAD